MDSTCRSHGRRTAGHRPAGRSPWGALLGKVRRGMAQDLLHMLHQTTTTLEFAQPGRLRPRRTGGRAPVLDIARPSQLSRQDSAIPKSIYSRCRRLQTPVHREVGRAGREPSFGAVCRAHQVRRHPSVQLPRAPNRSERRRRPKLAMGGALAAHPRNRTRLVGVARGSQCWQPVMHDTVVAIMSKTASLAILHSHDLHSGKGV